MLHNSSIALGAHCRCGIEEGTAASLIIANGVLNKLLSSNLCHPTTYLNLALLYQRVNKWDK